MLIKEKVMLLKQLSLRAADLSEQQNTVADKIKETELAIKAEMDLLDMTKFESPIGIIEIVDREKCYVKAENKDELIRYFESNPNLAPAVKTVKDVHYQTYNSYFKNLLKETNTLPAFVEINTWKELKTKFL